MGCHLLLQCRKVKSESEVVQSCLTLRDPTDCSLPGSSIHGIFQARVLEWVHSMLAPAKTEVYSIGAPLKGSRPYLYFFLYSDPTTLGFLLSFKRSHPHKFVSISACCTHCSLISPQIVLGLYTAASWLAKPTFIPKSFLPCLPPLQKLENYPRTPPPHCPTQEYLRARSIGHDRVRGSKS